MDLVNVGLQNKTVSLDYQLKLDPLVQASILGAEYQALLHEIRPKKRGNDPMEAEDGRPLDRSLSRHPLLVSFTETLKLLSITAPRAVAEFLLNQFGIEDSNPRKLAPIEDYTQQTDPVLVFAKDFYKKNPELIRSLSSSPSAFSHELLFDRSEQVHHALSAIRTALSAPQPKGQRLRSILGEVITIRDVIVSEMKAKGDFDMRSFWRQLSGVSGLFSLPGPRHPGWKNREEEREVLSALLSGTPVSQGWLDARLAYIYLRDSKEKRTGTIDISLDDVVYTYDEKYGDRGSVKQGSDRARAFENEFNKLFATRLGVKDFADGVERILTPRHISDIDRENFPFIQTSPRLSEIHRHATRLDAIEDWLQDARRLKVSIERAEKGDLAYLLNLILSEIIPRKIPHSYAQILTAFKELTNTDFLQRLIPICRKLLDDPAVNARFNVLLKSFNRGEKLTYNSRPTDLVQVKAEFLLGLYKQGLLVRNFTAPLGEAVKKRLADVENDREFKMQLKAHLSAREIVNDLNLTTDESDFYRVVSHATVGRSRTELARIEKTLGFQPVFEGQYGQTRHDESEIKGEVDYSFIPGSIKELVARKRELNFPENLHYVDTLVEKKKSPAQADAEKLYLLISTLDDLTHPTTSNRIRTSSTRETGLHTFAQFLGAVESRDRSAMINEFNQTWLPKLAQRADAPAHPEYSRLRLPPRPLPTTLGGWLDRVLTVSDRVFNSWSYFRIQDFRKLAQ